MRDSVISPQRVRCPMDGSRGRRYAVFAAGVVVTAAGNVVLTRAAVGNSPPVTIPYVLSEALPLSYGMFTMLFNFLLVGIQGAVSWRSLDRAGRTDLVLELGVAVVFGALMDLFMALLGGFDPEGIPLKCLCLLIGLVFTAFTAYIQAVADVTMLPADGVSYAIAVRSGRRYGIVRVSADTLMAVIAACIGFATVGYAAGIGPGTVVICLLTGVLANIMMSRLGRLTEALVPGRSLEALAEGER